MNTSESKSQDLGEPLSQSTRREPISFAEWFVTLNGLTPLLMMMYDARLHQLGADPTRNALHTTGSLALAFLIATLSITPLRRVFRCNWLTEYRRPLGLVTFFYALTHLAIYVGYDQGWNWNAAGHELLARRYLLFGTASTLLMLPLALTSSPWWIKKLTYPRWKRLHCLIYPSAILATMHYFAQSKADLRWQYGFAIGVAALLIWRIAFWIRMPRKTRVGLDSRVRVAVTIEIAGQKYCFQTDNKTTLLNAAEQNQVQLPSRCRAGVCGTCKVRLISGAVDMTNDQALSQHEREQATILACQAFAKSSSLTIAREDFEIKAHRVDSNQ